MIFFMLTTNAVLGRKRPAGHGLDSPALKLNLSKIFLEKTKLINWTILIDFVKFNDYLIFDNNA